MSLLKTNEIQNYNGSSLTLTASTVSTSAQLNTGGNISVTGSLNVSDDSTTRTNLGLGTIATQDSDSITVTGGTATLGALTVSGSGLSADYLKSPAPTGANGTGSLTNYYKVGRIVLTNSQSAEIEFLGSVQSYSGGFDIAGKTTLHLKGSNSTTTLEGYFYGETQGNSLFTDLRYVNVSSNAFDIYVRPQTFMAIEPYCKTTGSWTPEITNTGSTSAPASSVVFDSFFTIATGTSNCTERMRIDSSGNVNISNLSASSDVQTDASKNLITTSDARLKNEIGLITESGIEVVKQIIPKYFSWKNDESNTQQLGFFAQDIHPVLPEAAPRALKYTEVGRDENGEPILEQVFDVDGNPDYEWGFTDRPIIAMCVKAIQEQQALIESQQSQIDELTARIEALETT